MGQKTEIQWTDATWNPIRGCSRVSEGCRNCYAELVSARFSGQDQPYEGLAKIVGKEARWTGEVRFIEKHLADPLRWKKPRRIFVNSMSDLFHEKVADEWLDQIFAVMALLPRHVFQCLTKRPERMRDYCASNSTKKRLIERIVTLTEGLKGCSLTIPGDNGDGLTGMSWPNVWLGVSVEDQKTADERIPLLLNTPAAVRWVSYEPALGPVNFSDIVMPDGDHLGKMQWYDYDVDMPKKIDWIACGGESGPGARPSDLVWYRAVRDQCKAAGVAFFMKQLGSRPESQHKEPWPFEELKLYPTKKPAGLWAIANRGHHGDIEEFPPDLRIREYPQAVRT